MLEADKNSLEASLRVRVLSIRHRELVLYSNNCRARALLQKQKSRRHQSLTPWIAL